MWKSKRIKTVFKMLDVKKNLKKRRPHFQIEIASKFANMTGLMFVQPQRI